MRYIVLLLLVGFISCESSTVELGRMEGFVPIYASAQASKQVSIEASKPTEIPGKIYAYQQYLFQVDQGKGIHIIDNTNPQQAQKIAFINIPLCSEIAIRSNFLYTNNLSDLIVFDISNIASPQLVSPQ